MSRMDPHIFEADARGSETNSLLCIVLIWQRRARHGKASFESPLSTRSRLLRQYGEKWRPATRLHTRNEFTTAARLPLRASEEPLRHRPAALLSAHVEPKLTEVYFSFFLFFLLSLVSARPPSSRATGSASTRPKNGDGRAGLRAPAFYLHVTEARRGGGRRR